MRNSTKTDSFLHVAAVDDFIVAWMRHAAANGTAGQHQSPVLVVPSIGSITGSVRMFREGPPGV
jgi:hypothetical protein